LALRLEGDALSFRKLLQVDFEASIPDLRVAHAFEHRPHALQMAMSPVGAPGVSLVNDGHGHDEDRLARDFRSRPRDANRTRTKYFRELRIVGQQRTLREDAESLLAARATCHDKSKHDAADRRQSHAVDETRHETGSKQ